MKKFVCYDGIGPAVEYEAEDAETAASKYAYDGDWNVEKETVLVDVHVAPVGDPEDRETMTVAVHPKPPACKAPEHDFQAPHAVVGGIKENPGVRANGGGVITEMVCVLCGLICKADSWGTHPVNGTQGHEIVVYDDSGAYDEALDGYLRDLRNAD